MARKLRLEFPRACYHVINRGNYRADIFQSECTKAAFETCLFEACAKSAWILHAFVVMRNHYHLAIETPEGNLVAGMQWLQATFANRFNRLRGERGHLFQGRYKALLVEEGDPLGLVCHYIHLNPARAGIRSVDRLLEFRHSSYWYLWHPRHRPQFLQFDVALQAADQLPDTTAGHLNYAAYLDWQMRNGPAGASKAYVRLSTGWALGSTAFKNTLIADHALAARTRAWETLGAREIRIAQWTSTLKTILRRLDISRLELAAMKKSAPLKLAVAAWMKTRTQASAPWLCQALALGHPDAFRRNHSHFIRCHRSSDPTWQKISEYSA